MTWDVKQLTAPTTEPVTLAEAKLWCRIEDDDTSQDAMVLLLITAARERAEQITARAFARRTFELRMDAFPADDAPIYLPLPPLVSVSYLAYATTDGDVSVAGSPQTWHTDLGGDSLPGRIAPLYGASWPSAITQPGSVRIGYTAGYVTSSQIPRLVRLWMQARVSTMYEFRETIVTGTIVNDFPRDYVDGLLDHYRARTFFA
jgi:uncharacterized phiE125 gp8 family phage protein